MSIVALQYGRHTTEPLKCPPHIWATNVITGREWCLICHLEPVEEIEG